MAVDRPASDAANVPESLVGYFTPTPGEPTDACPLCGIHRQHAGNPNACGGGWRKIGCFDPDSHDEAEKMRRLEGWLADRGIGV